MKHLLWILGLSVTAAAVALATAAMRSASYVLLVYPPYRVELSLLLFAFLSLATFVFGYGLVRLTISILHLPVYVRLFRQKRAEEKARKLMDEALGAYFEGRYAAAEKAATRAMELSDNSALYPIIAARSAHELHEFKKRDAYLSAAADKSPGDATMRLMSTGKFMLDQHNPRGALSAMKALRDSGVKNHVGALTLELKAQQQAGNWEDVMRLLDKLEKHSSIDAVAAEQLRQQAWLEKLRQQNDLEGLYANLKKIPADLKLQSKVAVSAARMLIRHGDGSLAQRLLADSLNEQWDSELVALYGDCISGDVVAQIDQAEKWLNLHKQDTGLLLALGKLCLQQQLWGKAQSYLDASVSVAPSSEAYHTLAQLAERMGNTGEAFRYRQKAMGLKTL